MWKPQRELPVGARQRWKLKRIHPVSSALKIVVGCTGSSRYRTEVLLDTFKGRNREKAVN
jgi:hypothetical protein